MASSNEQISMPPPPSKSRLSPLDFRNTELVSRLLAATPPYLYNMSLLPNSYFFSEMLRSLVQAKQESAANVENIMNPSTHPRRARKRPWLIQRPEEYPKPPPKVERTEINDWTKLSRERLNLTELNTSKSPESRLTEEIRAYNRDKPPPFQMRPDPSNPGLILPPAPPIWFPPIYPSPYVDPLHFFIDLRVSGHIYDKSQKDNNNFDRNKEYPSTIVSSNSESEKSSENGENVSSLILNRYGSHNSAFSVPVPKTNSNNNNNTPMNLSQVDKEIKRTRFDVKSMGFEKNKIGTTYILSNIESIYKDMNRHENNFDKQMNECSEGKRAKIEDDESNIGFKFFSSDSKNEGIMSKPCFSRGISPVDVMDSRDQEYKIDIQT